MPTGRGNSDGTGLAMVEIVVAARTFRRSLLLPFWLSLPVLGFEIWRGRGNSDGTGLAMVEIVVAASTFRGFFLLPFWIFLPVMGFEIWRARQYTSHRGNRRPRKIHLHQDRSASSTCAFSVFFC